jgi:hypothetical protein
MQDYYVGSGIVAAYMGLLSWFSFGRNKKDNKTLSRDILCHSLTFSVRHLNVIKSTAGWSFLGIKPLPALQQMYLSSCKG